ncbi:pyruvate dehydrogenase (acetyl-transferring) E1 component subunit alpha [Cryocola sp. 340MFSha3.1]|uniref:pyruvate dehydrogenase (acetyl-transferring) E1 component subunit alpha n=1 Tax=Cryocola sp. 340MFSha3.1 TaxID=1169145 RepID=UPI00035CC8E6|nr:pyruvate dehydrogenase (acetyl-transferring) E1 component subunit alpha [Cryocola sp. 340MFSha3.1]
MTIDNQPATRRGGSHTDLGAMDELRLGEDGLRETSMSDLGLVRLLDSDGVRHEDDRYDAWVSDIGTDQLLALYEDMQVIRRIDAEATALQRQGELGLWPPLLGQEAAQIGSGRALRTDDFVFSSYREHGVAYCRGAGLVDLLRVWRGTTQSGWNPYDINMATPQVIIGAQTLHATGYALGIQADGTDAVAVAYFGDGATSEGDVNEALIFAATYAAPVIFFCQNNQYAISEPVSLQAQRPIADRAPGFGVPSVRVDGNDVLAVLAVTRAALDRARSGGGPTFIEAVTYRMGPHTTADDPTRYRDASELDAWRGKDPLARVEAYLVAQGALTDDRRAAITAKADAVAAEMRAGITTLADPDPLTVFDNVYAEPHTGLTRQRDHYSRYLRTFVGSDGR